ncbi:NACHT, LRR and PYD domains-containing protein 3-like [Spheniscus humboldti]
MSNAMILLPGETIPGLQYLLLHTQEVERAPSLKMLCDVLALEDPARNFSHIAQQPETCHIMGCGEFSLNKLSYPLTPDVVPQAGSGTLCATPIYTLRRGACLAFHSLPHLTKSACPKIETRMSCEKETGRLSRRLMKLEEVLILRNQPFQQADTLSLVDLISACCPCGKVPPEGILASPEKLLFIVDGFDELRFSLDQPKNKLCSDCGERKPVEIILSSLFQKTLLSQSSLLITTRPTALQRLGQCLKEEHYAEIMGFSDAEKEEYFHKFFRDEEKAVKAVTFVKRNDTLFAMCLVPVVCWTICTVLEQELHEGKILSRSCESDNLKQDMKKFLSRLCCMAANGIWKQEILFHEKEIEVYGLNHPVLLSLFLNESVLRNRMRCVSVYSFLHLSFQEFFAALFYALEDNEQTEELGTPGKDIKKVLEKYSEYDTNWILVVRFLFGLLNEETSEYLIERTGCKISPRVKEDLLKWIQIGQGTTPVLVE